MLARTTCPGYATSFALVVYHTCANSLGLSGQPLSFPLLHLRVVLHLWVEGEIKISIYMEFGATPARI